MPERGYIIDNDYSSPWSCQHEVILPLLEGDVINSCLRNLVFKPDPCGSGIIADIESHFSTNEYQVRIHDVLPDDMAEAFDSI